MVFRNKLLTFALESPYSPGVVMSEKSKLCSCNCRVKTIVKVSKKEFNSKNNFKCINSLHFTKVIV